MPAELIRAEPLDTPTDPPCRFILPAPTTGWSQLALGVWELRQSEHGDCHPHDEVNYVLEGTLIVDCDGESVEARPGDVVRVPAGRPAFYRAPDYARMVFVYGPNPEGLPPTTFPDPSIPGKRPDHTT